MAAHPSVAIIGGGAIGLAYAAHLSRVAEVTVIDRNAGTLKAANSGSLEVCLRNDDGIVSLPVDFGVVAPGTPFDADWVLVCVKSYSTAEAARTIRTGSARQDCLVVSIQNGLGNREVLEAELGAERVRVGICHVAAKRLVPGRVEVGRAGVTQIGRRVTTLPWRKSGPRWRRQDCRCSLSPTSNASFGTS